MQKYERLSGGQHEARRTVADALEVLRSSVGFTDNDRATIRIDLLRLPSRQVVGLINLLFEAPNREEVYVTSLPTSAYFEALQQGSSRRVRFEISQLEGALADGRGNIRLSNGEALRAVEVVPANLPLLPSELDYRIVGLTVSLVGGEQQCLRSLKDGVPSPYRDLIPDLRYLDCSKLSGLKIPALKVVAAYIGDRDPTLRLLSPQKISDALEKFGVRLPARRRRRSPARPVSAAI